MRNFLPEATKLDISAGEKTCNVICVTVNGMTGMDLPQEVLIDAGDSGKFAL